MSLTIVKNYLKNNRCYQQNTKCNKIGLQLHTIGTGQGTAKSVADYWNSSQISACVHYIVDCDTAGKILQLLDEDVRSWADAGYGNNNLITFEICESDHMKYSGGANFTVSNETACKADILRGYRTAVQLCAKICKERGWNPTARLDSGLYLISSHDEGRCLGLSSAHVDPTHIWPRFGLDMEKFRADVKECMKTGDFSSSADSPETSIYYRVGTGWENGKCTDQLAAYTRKANALANCPPGYKVFDPTGKVFLTTPKTNGTAASVFTSLSESEAAAKILEMARTDGKKYNILPSVTAAQMILESGYVKTELAVQANNCFGMKTSLSGNTWSGSTWDGKSKYTKKTAEEYTPGKITYITADFRKYPTIEDSISDHSAYLLHAKNGKNCRYAGLTDAKNYKEAITIIKNGGYATDSHYIDKICSLIARFSLDAHDVEISAVQPSVPAKETPQTFTPYLVRIDISDLRIRSGAGTNFASAGFIPKGIYTIIEEKQSGGYAWGRLKSGRGWIALDYTTKL